MIDKSETINELATALAKAQAAFTHVKKDKTARIEMKAGGAYTYRYADLGSTWDVARKALTDNGLSVVQAPSFADGWIELTTVLLHSSGQYISSAIRTRASENDVKSLGSAITYLRRYAFSAMTGLVADEDDDGDGSNASQQRPQGSSTTTGAANGHTTPSKASEKQIKMLFAIWNKEGYDGKLSEWIEAEYHCKIDALTMQQASNAIETLQPKAKPGVVPDEPLPL